MNVKNGIMRFMNKHTSGPWLVGPQQSVTSRGWAITDKNGNRLAFVIGEQSPELQANARLIAAAPELLSVLEDVDEFLNFAWRDIQMNDYSFTLLEDVICKVQSLIAKIEGE